MQLISDNQIKQIAEIMAKEGIIYDKEESKPEALLFFKPGPLVTMGNIMIKESNRKLFSSATKFTGEIGGATLFINRPMFFKTDNFIDAEIKHICEKLEIAMK
jgi:hypothetical protein